MSEPSNLHELENRLDRLFAEYRSQCPDPEPGANFMPALWSRIENSRSFTVNLRRWAQAFATAAAAISLLMALYLVIPQGSSPVYSVTYLDVLSGEHSPDALAYDESTSQ